MTSAWRHRRVPGTDGWLAADGAVMWHRTRWQGVVENWWGGGKVDQWRGRGGDVRRRTWCWHHRRGGGFRFDIAPLFSMGGIGGGASEHAERMTRGGGTTGKAPIPRTLTSDWSGRENDRPPLDLECWPSDGWRGDRGGMQLLERARHLLIFYCKWTGGGQKHWKCGFYGLCGSRMFNV